MSVPVQSPKIQTEASIAERLRDPETHKLAEREIASFFGCLEIQNYAGNCIPVTTFEDATVGSVVFQMIQGSCSTVMEQETSESSSHETGVSILTNFNREPTGIITEWNLLYRFVGHEAKLDELARTSLATMGSKSLEIEHENRCGAFGLSVLAPEPGMPVTDSRRGVILTEPKTLVKSDGNKTVIDQVSGWFSRRDVATALHKFINQDHEFISRSAHVLSERDSESMSEDALYEECMILSKIACEFFDFPIREMELERALWTTESTSLYDTVQLMRGESGENLPQGYIFVEGEENSVGIFTVRDYVCKVIPNIDEVLFKPIGETNVFTRNATSVSLDTSFRDVIQTFVDNHFRHLPVVNELGEVQFAITLRDVVEYVTELDNGRISTESVGRPFFLWRGDTTWDFLRPGYQETIGDDLQNLEFARVKGLVE